MDKTKLLLGDSLETLKTLDANSIDAMVTDPPAGISFMGKTWDSHKGGRKEWIAWLCEVMEEALRVLKPGAYGLVWALPRTSHWTGMALEDAGFEVRDCVYHLFGSGFPKSLNVGKAVDKLQGNERAVAPPKQFADGTTQRATARAGIYSEEKGQAENTVGTGVWEGYGTALKPAVECWWLVRKPLAESTVAKNVLEYGTGALNIEASRVDGQPRRTHGDKNWSSKGDSNHEIFSGFGDRYEAPMPAGRWPSHLIHDGSDVIVEQFPNDSARFFYCAKSSKVERNAGLDGFEEKARIDYGGSHSEQGLINNNRNPENRKPTKNNHPTVKAQALMRYLCKLIAPPGTPIILDPFMGSGSTGVACKALGYDFVGIELDAEYLEIAKARIDHAKPLEVVEQLDILKQQDSD
jgi:site-specific DNA-methyltransferase (adenine-specific)